LLISAFFYGFLCVGVGRFNCTLHWGLWICLLFWFKLFSSCVLSVGSEFAPHSHHGFNVGVCGSMLETLFIKKTISNWC
jgi:hypothetical protein